METSIKVWYRDEKTVEFGEKDIDALISLVKRGFFENTLSFIQMDHESSNEMQIEFGDKCCFISMADEDEGMIYGYMDPEQSDEESVDLCANSYPANMLCRSVDDVAVILKTFVSTGRPNEDYTWDEQEY